MDLDFVQVHKHEFKKKKELGQYPAILTSHLVNNPSLSYHYVDKLHDGLKMEASFNFTACQ